MFQQTGLGTQRACGSVRGSAQFTATAGGLMRILLEGRLRQSLSRVRIGFRRLRRESRELSGSGVDHASADGGRRDMKACEWVEGNVRTASASPCAPR